MRTIGTLLLIPALAVLFSAVVLAAGLVDFSASAPRGCLEERLARFALDRSIAHHAPKQTAPLPGSPEAITAAFSLFGAHCVACHGAPGADPSEAGASLNPPAPGLTLARIQKRSDGELFWIVSHGIRMTGMPAFGPSRRKEEIWQLIAAVRRLPRLSEEERQALTAGRIGCGSPRSK